MKISAKAEYACLAILALARVGRGSAPVHIHDISDAYVIPERYLVQILQQLKGAGLVESTRGASGGYRLAREASAITLGQVITAVDGPDPRRRPKTGIALPTRSVLDSVWDDVKAAEQAVLDRTTFGQLAELNKAPEWTI
jgi:Rrf2 family transcriptional regulator, cysteine metabolism repressor